MSLENSFFGASPIATMGRLAVSWKVRAGAIAALHLMALAIMLRTESGWVGLTQFALFWVFLNCAFLAVLRRLGLLLCYMLGINPGGIIGQHLANARAQGIWKYLELKNFTHRNTDGPLNPYALVYDLGDVRRDFPDFEIVRAYKRFMHAPPLPIGWLPLGRLLGWHLWIHLKPKKK